MVNIIFAKAVYLMHILVIIGWFHYLLVVLCVYKSSSFGVFKDCIEVRLLAPGTEICEA